MLFVYMQKHEYDDTKKNESCLFSENKGADQPCTANLRLCFRIGNNPVFSQRGSNVGTRRSHK